MFTRQILSIFILLSSNIVIPVQDYRIYLLFIVTHSDKKYCEITVDGLFSCMISVYTGIRNINDVKCR